jgi:hypothetical protein
MPTLVPLHVTKGFDCICKNNEKTVVPTMSGFFVWYLKCLLPFITCIMHKLSREAIFLEHLLYFGITDGCDTKVVFSFSDVSEIVNLVEFTPH